MGDNIRTIKFEVAYGGENGSLYEFICREINPLLDSGWSVCGVRIVGPARGDVAGVRLEVALRQGIWAEPGLGAAY